MADQTMYAIKKASAAPGLTGVSDAPVPDVGDTDVLIAVTHAGICGTDRHIFEWDEWSANRVKPPLTIGHEFGGTVVEVGAAVTDIRVGQRVSAEGHIGCGVCHLCRTGRSHICERVEVIGIDRNGTFADYIVMPRQNVWPLGDAISTRVASIMDPLGNAMHTVMSAGVSGHSVLISGVGVIGLMAVAIAKQAGATQIIATDVEPHHLQRAQELGADHALRADDPEWAAQARSLSPGGDGVDAWLEMSGAAPAIQSGFAALANGGTVAMLGLPKRAVEVELAESIILKGATVLGISGRLMYENWYQMERFLSHERNATAIEALITHEYAAKDYEQAFAKVTSGEAIKVILTFGKGA